MIRPARSASAAKRRVLMTLALLALALNVIVPPGLMPARSTNALPFVLVLCTGQGAMVVSLGQTLSSSDHQDPVPTKSTHDSPCVFAGHGQGVPAASLVDAGAVALVAYSHSPGIERPDLVPATGSAGPPLPARGPPTQSI